MSISPSPLADSPLFEGRPPLLVVPAVIILGLVLVYGPGKYLKRGRVEGDKVLELSVPAVMTGVANVVSTAWIYLNHDPTPLAVGSPATMADFKSGQTARIVKYSVILAAVAAFVFQLGIAYACSRLFRGGWHKYLLLAALGFVLTIGSVLYTVLSDFPGGLASDISGTMTFSASYPSDQPFTLQVKNLALPGCACALYFDGALTVELYKLRGAIAKGDARLHSRMLRITQATFGVALVATLLTPLCVLLGMLPDGWLSFNLEFGGYLSCLHMHAVSLLLMLQAIEEDEQPGVATAVGYQLRTDISARPGHVLSDV